MCFSTAHGMGQATPDRDADVQAIFDVSGFAYTDQQGETARKRTQIMAAYVKKWKQRGKKSCFCLKLLDLYVIHHRNSNFVNQNLEILCVLCGSFSGVIKGMLGNCSFVISSRYHGLINALSQGVLCIATSWSLSIKCYWKTTIVQNVFSV